MIIVLGWSIAYLKRVQIDFPEIIVGNDRFVVRPPNDFSGSLGSSQRTTLQQQRRKSRVTRIIITSNAYFFFYIGRC